jgi:hypothetical protein
MVLDGSLIILEIYEIHRIHEGSPDNFHNHQSNRRLLFWWLRYPSVDFL